MLPHAGLQWWAYLLIVLAVLTALLAVSFGIWKYQNKTRAPRNFDPDLFEESFPSAEDDVDIQEVQVVLDQSRE